jgi:cellulose synthase/poly-beta-1,6-N-acetylglucosamine synthase-like glycosyltransferase
MHRVAGILADHAPDVVARVVIAVDHRSAHPVESYERLLGKSALVVRGDPPGGKATALNAGMRSARTDIVLLLDTPQSNPSGSLAALVSDMAGRRECGAITGVVSQRSGDAVMDLYWRYELMIRRGQDALHSIVTTSGSITAVRRALWLPLPAELICDDLFLTTQLVLRGHRVGFCDRAFAVDERTFSREQHFQRKVRTLTGLYQFIRTMPEVLVPWRNPIWVHFVTHKLMRFTTPPLLVIVAMQALWWLASNRPRALSLAASVITLGVLIVGAIRPAALRRVWTQLAWMAKLQLVPMVALANGLRGNWSVWRMHEPLEKRNERP